MIESVIFYTVCWVFAYFLAKLEYKIASGRCEIEKNYSRKISFLSIILIATLCTAYNYYITETSPRFGGDRTNYKYDFDTGRFNPSVGITFLYNIFHQYNLDFNDLLYVSTFVPIVIALITYKYSRDAKPNALLLYFLTPVILFSFTALKQVYADACTSLMIVLAIQRPHTKLKDILCILLIVVACLFHTSSYLAPIIFIILRYNFKTNPAKLYFWLIVTIVFFKHILFFIADISSSLLPILADKIYYYFSDREIAGNGDGGIMVTLKGMPYYYITFIAFKYRKGLKSIIVDYDKYLLLFTLCSLFYCVSFYDVWMARMCSMIVFPVLICWCKILPKIPNYQIHNLVVLSMIAFFTYRLLILIYINFGFF
jgi:hypothetical protein